MDGNNESEEQASLQQDQETALTEFEDELREERIELERLRAELTSANVRLAELESQRSSEPEPVTGGDDSGDALTVTETTVLSEDVLSDNAGTGPGDTPSPVVERPPRSNHPLFRRLWGRDLDGPEPGEHWIHRKLGTG